MNTTEIFNATGLDNYDTSALNLPSMPSFMDIVSDAITGQLDLSLPGLWQLFVNTIFAEFFNHGTLIRQLVVIAILSALLAVLSETFKSAGQTSIYITFLMTAALAVSSFHISVGLLQGLMSTVDVVMNASIPIMVGLMALSGNFIGAAGVNSLMFIAFQLLTRFISMVFIPLILAAAALDVCSKLSEDGIKLAKLSDLASKVAGWLLKGILALFAFLLTLQRVSSPITSNFILRSTRSAMSAVPVVGGAFSAAMDTVINFAQVARSGVLVALVITICVIVLTPLLKIFALSFLYKLVAALLEPVADKRLSALMDSIGKHLSMIFRAAGLIGVMCIFTVVILLTF